MADDGSAHGNYTPRIGIDVSTRNGKLALKYALDYVVPPGGTVCLLHVQTTPRFIPVGDPGFSDPGKFLLECKAHMFLAAAKLVDEYKAICLKKKVKTEEFFTESNTVGEGLLDQILKLGLTTLVVAKSSQSGFSEGVEDISDHVAACAPSFCTVLVIHKGKLHSSNATQSSSLHRSPLLPTTSALAPSGVRASNVSETSRWNLATVSNVSETLSIQDQITDTRAVDDVDVHEPSSSGSNIVNNEVELLSSIHHPHIVMFLGACLDKRCIVYEHMAYGSLGDCLRCDGTSRLLWSTRFRICLEVATALLFLRARAQPIIHGNLKVGNILLDDRVVSKIGDVGLMKHVPSNSLVHKEMMPLGMHIDPDYLPCGARSCNCDVYSLGIVMLQLLTGWQDGEALDVVEDALADGCLGDVLDKSAGDWPLEQATSLTLLSLQCIQPWSRNRPDLRTKVIPELEKIQHDASMTAIEMSGGAELSSSNADPITPTCFFCPISEDIMENPHMAADGFTYEHDAIQTWFQEHDTSPMTNLVMTHKNLLPNYSLRSSIKQWQELGLIGDLHEG